MRAEIEFTSPSDVHNAGHTVLLGVHSRNVIRSSFSSALTVLGPRAVVRAKIRAIVEIFIAAVYLAVAILTV